MPNSIQLKDINGNAIYPSINVSEYTGEIADENTGFVIGGDVYSALETVSGEITALIPTNFYPMTGNPSGFLTSETNWTTTIQEASAKAYNDAYAAATAYFASVSGEIVSAIENKFGYTN